MDKLYGLIGYPLSHSFSAGYFASKFEREQISGCRYEPFSIEKIGLFPDLLKKHPELNGLNVTIPYKESVIPFLDSLDQTAAEVGAVNTITIRRKANDILTRGFNTDVYGFERSLEANDVRMPSKALILGTGGAAKAVEWVLKKHECQIFYATRNPSAENHLAYNELDHDMLSSFLLVVNSTPLGMYPQTEACPPIPVKGIGEKHTFFDLIYNPPETVFLKRARKKGAKTINGLFMLEQQAEKAWEIWNRIG